MTREEIKKFLSEGVMGSSHAKTDVFLNSLMTAALNTIKELEKKNAELNNQLKVTDKTKKT